MQNRAKANLYTHVHPYSDPTHPMKLSVIGSMATKGLLAALCQRAEEALGCTIALTAIGGVDAAKRVAAGEFFDVVCLGSPAMATLSAAGHVRGAPTPIVVSSTMIATPTDAPPIDVHSAAALRLAVLNAKTIGVSTGPSGVALQKLFSDWGIADDIKDRMVIPPPGTPVARLIASGEVALGFQQQSELMGVTGVTVIGALPAEVAIDTIFSAAVAQTTGHAELAQQLIAHWNSAENVSLKQAHGMQAV